MQSNIDLLQNWKYLQKVTERWITNPPTSKEESDRYLQIYKKAIILTIQYGGQNDPLSPRNIRDPINRLYVREHAQTMELITNFDEKHFSKH